MAEMRQLKEEIVGNHSAAFARWLPEASQEEIDWLLRKHDLTAQQRELLLIEVADRRRKEHWSLAPMFWLTLITACFAGIAAWPIVRDWIWTNPPIEKGATAQPFGTPRAMTQAPTPPIAAASLLPRESVSPDSTPTPRPQEPPVKETPQKSPSG